jgi:hypothetical protein
VTVTITPVNDAPVVLDSAVATSSNAPVTGAFIASDPDGDTLTFAIARLPKRGTVVAVGGTFTYTPRAGFVGTDSFTVRAHDGTIASAQATVTVTVR